jgi:hypothetical protein
MQPEQQQQQAREEAHQFLQMNSQPFILLPPGVGMQSEAGQILPPGMQPMPQMEPMDIDSENELFTGAVGAAAAAAGAAAGAALPTVDEGAEADRSRQSTSLSPFRAWAEQPRYDDAAAATSTEDVDRREKPRNFTSFFLNPSHFNPRSELLHTVNAEGDTVNSSDICYCKLTSFFTAVS